MKKARLIVSDLDGTLLLPDGTISAENCKAIEKITKLGVELTVSSGRAYGEIPNSIKENPYIRYICHSNGAIIYDKLFGKNVVENYIDEIDKERVLKILERYDYLLCLHSEGIAYFEEKKLNSDVFKKYHVNSSYQEVFCKMPLVADVREKTESVKRAESLVLFFADDGELFECKRRLEALKGITVTSSIEHNIEICSGQAGKGRALEALFEILGVSADEVIALGDSTNDLEMFEVAGLSVCTANGNAEAKKRATLVGPSNDEHIAKYVLENLL